MKNFRETNRNKKNFETICELKSRLFRESIRIQGKYNFQFDGKFWKTWFFLFFVSESKFVFYTVLKENASSLHSLQFDQSLRVFAFFLQSYKYHTL